jgi:hypothetical protein
MEDELSWDAESPELLSLSLDRLTSSVLVLVAGFGLVVEFLRMDAG